RLDGDLRVGRAAARAALPSRTARIARRTRAAHSARRRDRPHPPGGQAARPAGGPPARAHLLTVSWALCPGGNFPLPVRHREAALRIRLLARRLLPRLLARARHLRSRSYDRPGDHGREARHPAATAPRLHASGPRRKPAAVRDRGLGLPRKPLLPRALG